ncbi:hypothetical protein [Christiangramia sediminis]|uniref:Uncharacterized protein n=1 Tax=Christiangramia sediminis TaxID=2881336 RepID=A0A9X1RWQ8_9FLAO|nr:hypothetical protein [Christiangramia sediminis]MCB7481833.1 hypothetical protein [Christiangramia sediminis]
MKNRKSFLLNIFLLQVLLLASATNAFAYSETTLDFDSRKGEFFKADQNKKAIHFEESISEAYFQTSSENENNYFHSYSNLEVGYDFIGKYSENRLSSEFQPNGRHILKTQIYPFHSFW